MKKRFLSLCLVGCLVIVLLTSCVSDASQTSSSLSSAIENTASTVTEISSTASQNSKPSVSSTTGSVGTSSAVLNQSSAASLENQSSIAITGSQNTGVSSAPASTTSKNDTSSKPEEVTDRAPSGTKFTMTQVQTISAEAYREVAKYQAYLAVAKKKHLVPGLEQNTVPQGIAVSPTDGRIYISSYSNSENTSSVILVLNTAGELVAEYLLKNNDGTPFTGHVGGIALSEKYLYVSSNAKTKGLYSLAEFALSDLPKYGSHAIKISTRVNVPIDPDYLFCANGILWVGNFYNQNTLGSVFNFTTTVDGNAYGGYAGAFVLDSKTARLKENASLGYAKPDYILATPDKVQGFAYYDGKVALSMSYGRKNDSKLSVYEVNLSGLTQSVTAGGVTYKFGLLGSTNIKKTYTALPMTEGLALTADGKLLVLFESGAKKYAEGGGLYPTDSIWEMKLS